MKSSSLICRVGIVFISLFIMVLLAASWGSAQQPSRNGSGSAGADTKSVDTGEKSDSDLPASDLYVFTREGKIDPFKPFIELLAIKDAPRPELPKEPLQKFNLSQLKVVGIIDSSDINQNARALVQDPSEKGYIITIGTKIGPNGEVIKITPTEVLVKEAGQEKPTVMPLRTSENK